MGDSREDLEVASVVGRLFLVSNAVAGDTSAFGNVDANGRVSRSGYFFAMFLPDATPVGGGAIPGFAEANGGGATAGSRQRAPGAHR